MDTSVIIGIPLATCKASAEAIEQLRGDLRSYTQCRAQWVGIDPSKVFKSRSYPGIDVTVESMDEIKQSAWVRARCALTDFFIPPHSS